MSGKMKWDRVSRENRGQAHGFELIDAESRVITSTGQLAPPHKPKTKPKLKVRRRAQSFAIAPGCMCGKPVGFVGLHKHTCPMSGKYKARATPEGVKPMHKSTWQPLTVQASGASLLLSDLVVRMHRVSLDGDLRRFLVATKRRLVGDRQSSDIDKDLAADAIHAILAEIEKYT